jgi:protein-histidine pros-kinase
VKLQTKFNLALSAAFVIGLALAAVFAFKISGDTARRDVLHEAALMASEGEGASRYTDQEVAPLLSRTGTGFAPQMIPFLAAQDQFRRVQKDWPDYSYKVAALNPTDPADKAADWEAAIINRFKSDANLKQYVTERTTAHGPVLSVAKPIRIGDAGCLQCHSTPDKAPAAMVALYGGANGFGWKLNDVIGAQIVSVPMSLALEHAHNSFLTFLGGLAAVFLVTMVALNLLLRFVVVRPASEIAHMANEVSLGRTDIPEYPVKSKDEIGSLAESFNRMRRSLTNAMKLLGED